MARPKALLLTTRADNSEMEELVWSLGYDIVATVQQNRSRPDPQFHVGRGKLADARDLARALRVDLVVVNEALKPSQMFNLYDFVVNGWEAASLRVAPGLVDAVRWDDVLRGAEDLHVDEAALDAAREDDALPALAGGLADALARAAPEPPDPRPPEVFDRVRVILEIFTERARSPEARLQVELAKLQYEAPLVKEFIHLSKKGERPGFLAGGEYEITQYYDRINRRMAKIREDLVRVSRERDVRRKHRRRSGFHLVSLAGYTNAGKSTLLRAVAAPAEGGAGNGDGGSDILVENRYFSTLGTKTRRAASDKREILVTDTVGFIEELPPWIVKAFHSTLEEIALADVVALVVDASDPYPELERKLRSSLITLWEFDARQHVDGDRASGMGHEGKQDATMDLWRDGNASSGASRSSDAGSTTDAMDAADATGTPHAVDATDTADTIHATDAANSAGTSDTTDTSGASQTGDPSVVAARRRDLEEEELKRLFAKDARRGPDNLAPIVVVLNKADAVPPKAFRERVRRLQEDGLIGENWVAVSAREKKGLDAFFESVYALLPGYVTFTAELPPSPETESVIAWLYENADVTDVQRGNEVRITFEVKSTLVQAVQERLENAHGRILEPSATH